MNSRWPKLAAPLTLVALELLTAHPASAAPAPQADFVNSLWIGTDNTQSRNVLNMDRSGAVLRTVGPLECTGFGVDVESGVIYFGTSNGGETVRDLATVSAGTGFTTGGTEDMTFDGTWLWRTGVLGPAGSTIITRIDPIAHTSNPGFTIPFETVGIAWDGTGFWISEFLTNGLVKRFDTAGNATGESFHTVGGHINGGVAFDPTDSTLFIGSFGAVYHYSRTGTALGSFVIPASQAPGRFIDGLEFEASATPSGVGDTPRPGELAISVWPNPSHGDVLFAMETPGPANVRIYDLAGRLVREMTVSQLSTGRLEMRWDGRNDSGTQVPSGLYFLDVRAGNASARRRISLIH